MSLPARENSDRRGGISVKLTGLDSRAYTIENSKRGGARWIFQAREKDLPVKSSQAGTSAVTVALPSLPRLREQARTNCSHRPAVVRDSVARPVFRQGSIVFPAVDLLIVAAMDTKRRATCTPGSNIMITNEATSIFIARKGSARVSGSICPGRGPLPKTPARHR